MKKNLTRFFFLLLMANGIFTPSMAITVPTVVVPSTTPEPKVNTGDLMKEFYSLSRKEKRERLKEVKKELRHFNKAKRHGDDPSTNTLLLVILAILLPPLAVYLHEGEINTKFWISLLLTLLFWVPGVIYALIVVLS